MKKVNFFCMLICTVILSIFFISCNGGDSNEFSHNPKIESWIQENKKEIINYDWKKVTTFSKTVQKAILRTMPPKKRKAIWQKKVSHILTLDLSKEEKEYLKWFSNMFKKINYEEATPEKLSIEMKNKALEAKDKFGWSDKFIHNLFFTTDNVVKKPKETSNQNLSKDLVFDDGEPETCDCKWDWGCGLGGNCLGAENGCPKDNGDCGFFGNDNCNGHCM